MLFLHKHRPAFGSICSFVQVLESLTCRCAEFWRCAGCNGIRRKLVRGMQDDSIDGLLVSQGIRDQQGSKTPVRTQEGTFDLQRFKKSVQVAEEGVEVQPVRGVVGFSVRSEINRDGVKVPSEFGDEPAPVRLNRVQETWKENQRLPRPVFLVVERCVSRANV